MTELMDEQEYIQSITITFRGNPNPLEFRNIFGYQLGSGFLGVMTVDGVTYIYPQDTVESAIHKQIPKE